MGKFWRAFCCVLAITMLLGACAPAEEAASLDKARLTELANEMSTDIAFFLTHRDNVRELAEEGVVVTTSTATYAAESLDSFCEEYSGSENSRITIISAKSAFVVSRVIFEDGIGCYLRYQHDPKNESDNYPITVKQIDSVNLVKTESGKSMTFELIGSKKKVASFPLKNIVTAGSSEVSAAG